MKIKRLFICFLVALYCVLSISCSEDIDEIDDGSENVVDITPRPDYQQLDLFHFLDGDEYLLNKWFTIPTRGFEGMQVDIDSNQIVLEFYSVEPFQVEYQIPSKRVVFETVDGVLKRKEVDSFTTRKHNANILKATLILNPSLQVSKQKYININIHNIVGTGKVTAHGNIVYSATYDAEASYESIIEE